MPARSDLAATMAPVTKALAQMEEAIARRWGLTMWRYAVLVAVRDEPGSNQSQIAARIGYDKNRIVSDLDALEAAGLLTRTPAADDRRNNQLALTAAGGRLAGELQAEVHAGEDALLAALPAGDRRAVHRSLATLRSRVADGSWLAPYASELG